MGKYVLRADDVDAVKLDASTGDIAIGDDVTVTAGAWLLKHTDGSFTTADDATFAAKYEAAPPTEGAVPDDAPPDAAPPDPTGAPVAV